MSASASTLRGAPSPAVGKLATAWERPGQLLFYALLLYFVLEYVRPPLISQLRLQMLFVLAVPVVWFLSKERPWSRSLTLLVVLMAYCASAVFWAYNYFSAYLITRSLFGFTAVALAITWVMSDREYFVRAIWFWVAIMLYQAVHAIFGGGRGSGGYIGDENDLALACVTAFPIAFLGARAFHGRAKLACVVLVVGLTAGVVASFSRGGFVAFAAVLGYCVLTGRHRVRNTVIGLVAAAIMLAMAPAGYRAEIRSITQTTTGTAEGRLFLWFAAWRMWLDHPLLGVGPASNIFLIGDYQPRQNEGGLFNQDMYRYRSWSGTAVHSLYFEALADLGVLGCLILAAIIADHLLRMRRLRRAYGDDADVPDALRRDVQIYGIGLSGAMVAYLSAGLFLSITYYPYVWYVTAMGVALENWARRSAASGRAGASPTPQEAG